MPILHSLRKKGVTANQLTISAVFLSLVMGLAVYFSEEYSLLILLIPIGYLIRMALNALDGMMATHYNMKSKLGSFFRKRR